MNIFITGATDGIGKQTALELAQKGHVLFIHGKNSKRTSDTKNWIISKVPSAIIETFKADLSSLSEVKQMADEFLFLGKSIDVLINNAGVFEKHLAYSADGFERTFAINHLAHFYLTLLLLPLIKSQPSARIINVASSAQASTIDFENLNAEKGYNAYYAYELSKLCNVLFTFKLTKELSENSITVNALDPGVISTKILHSGWGIGGGSLHSGAATSVFLATSLEGGQSTGHYYENKQQYQASRAAYIKENQEKLWKISLEMSSLNLT
ncbi:MAG: SDR family NAD(P)-dependent oxidoreductase [Bacteroidales bacterium]|jgi:NAD(P)-dependent dehydrogenase (short-subunit alcohol dehydrogenase family)|nr:SDR family NAD(P)-dependent oxidoreductase [Bacteroidales bacterium]